MGADVKSKTQQDERSEARARQFEWIDDEIERIREAYDQDLGKTLDKFNRKPIFKAEESVATH